MSDLDERDPVGAAGPEWRALHSRVSGVLVPGMGRYETLRKPAEQRFHHIRPAAVVRCETVLDVATAIACAGRTHIPVAVRSGGHDFAGRSTTTGMVLDLGGMNRISVDGTSVTVGPGARLADIRGALSPRGRALPAGSEPTVGIGGLTLGGGLGVLGRLHGLTCDSLTGAEAVLADGRLVQCDDEHHPDLFWALRGGGAMGVGIVTKLVFDTVPQPAGTLFRLTWRWSEAAGVVDAWQRWAPDLPRHVAASLLLNAPAGPGAGPAVTVVGSAATVGPGAVRDLLEPLTSSVGVAPQQEWQDAHPPAPEAALATPAASPAGRHFSRSEYFRGPIPLAVIRDLVEQLTTDPRPGEARELDFSPWGGAYNRPAPDDTAFPHRRERFLLKHGATIHPDPARRGSGLPSGWLDRSWHRVHPFGSGGVYPNFPDPLLADPEGAYYGPNLGRLQRVKAAYDPAGLLPTAAPATQADAR